MGENSTPKEYEPPKLARLAGVVLPVTGLALALAGMLIAWINRTTYIGWFSYAPLSSQPFSESGMAFLSPGTQAGLAIAVAGMLILAFWAGYRLGQKGRRARKNP